MLEPFAFDDLPEPSRRHGSMVAERARRVLRPEGALRSLDEVAVWLAQWQRTGRPSVDRPVAIIFAADHGVASEGVSAYPQEVTKAMEAALQAGVATASVMARALGVALEMVDCGVGEPTGNIRVEPALDVDRFAEAAEAGHNAVKSIDADLLILGEMGIANTTSAAALCVALLGTPAERWVGAGTGLDSEGVRRKTRVVEEAVARVGEVEPIEALRQLGGAEMVALAAACLTARRRSIPVLLDGFVVTAALMTLELARPGALAHCWPGHVSAEPGHRLLVERLARRPMLDLGLRLGEGSGALAALPLVGLAARAVVEVATFEEWGLA